jgi:CarD family transcriptional regulator
MSDPATIDVGDEVVHPRHGPGVVTGTETLDVGAGPTSYLVVELASGMTVKVPADSVDGSGLREPVTRARAEEVLAILGGPPAEDPGYRVRRRRHEEKLATGRLVDCAEIVRDLTAVIAAHDEEGSHFDRRLLAKCRKRLVAELSVALGVDESEADDRVTEALQRRDAT